MNHRMCAIVAGAISLLSAGTPGVLDAQSAENPALTPWTLVVSPSAVQPLLADDFSLGSPFATSWGGGLTAEYALGLKNLPLSLRAGLGYAYGTLSSSDNIAVPGSLNEVSLLAGAIFEKDLNSLMSLHLFLDGGAVYGDLNSSELSSDQSAFYGVADLGGGLGFKLTSSLSARLDLAAVYKAGLYSGLGASLGLGYALPAKTNATKPKLLELMSISMKSVFPVLRSYYDQNPVGTAKIQNKGKEAATDVRVSFLIKQYMDAPKECAVIPRIEPGATIEVPLYALFNDSILNVTEATKVSGEVSLDYNASENQNRSTTVLVYDRNAITWSDNRKAAAFVSTKDPWVLDLAGNFMADVKDRRNAGLAQNLQTAIAIHEGLRAYGLGYMLTTTRPFEQAVVDPEVVDNLKYPRQTLSFKSGDCADLSVLYASCLEAAGVESAFVTIPGHIFIAADLGLTPDQARTHAIDPQSLIEMGGRLWIPIETTMRDSDFLTVWQKGAEEWRIASDKKTAAFYPVHEAWDTYAPMGLPADGSAVVVPASAKVLTGFSSSDTAAVDKELGARISALGAIPDSGVAASTALNNRGVLYGRYGRLDKAQADFQAAAKAGSVPALVNLGNVALLRSDSASAYKYFHEATLQLTGSAALYINLAKAAAALGKSSEEKAAIEKARAIDPKAVDTYTELAQVSSGSGTRAAEVQSDQSDWM